MDAPIIEPAHIYEYVKKGCILCKEPKRFCAMWIESGKKPCITCEYVKVCLIIVYKQ
jgi:hypothetical protein